MPYSIKKMTSILANYVKEKILEEVIFDFYDRIRENDLVKHYFLAAKKSGILADLKKYHFYLAEKSGYDYFQTPVASSNWDVQLPESQFKEVVHILGKILIAKKINPDYIPQLKHEILEIIEETRSQSAETEVSTLYLKEASPDKINQLLTRHRIRSEVMPSREIKTEKGLQHPVWIDIDYDNINLVIKSKIYFKVGASNTEILELHKKVNGKIIFLEPKIDSDASAPYLYDHHFLPFAGGIPIRLLIRYLRRFSMEFSQLYTFDNEKILKA